MRSKPRLADIRAELAELKNYEVILYGSYVSGFTARSDIDIAIITRNSSREQNRTVWRMAIGKAPAPRYDIKVFELLPLHIQASVMNKYIAVFGDLGEISEYFYHFRKLWKDVEPRYTANQFSSIKEKLMLMKAAEGG